MRKWVWKKAKAPAPADAPASEVKPRPRATKIKRFNTGDKWFWVKLGGFAIWLAFVLASIVTFVGRDLLPFFTLKSEAGVGLLLTPVAWGLWFISLGQKTMRGVLITNVLASAVLIPALVLALSVATAICGSLAAALTLATFAYRLWRVNDVPHPLVIKLNG